MQIERRQHPRQPVDRASKLFHEPSLRYSQARTIDLSDTGVLIEARLIRAILEGDPVRVAIDWMGQGVVDATQMRSARVVRAEPEQGGVRRIALAFDRPLASRVAA